MQANRSLTADSSTKVAQTETKINYQATDKILFEWVVQSLSNRSIPGGGGQETENRKTARMLTVSYRLTKDTQLVYQFNLVNDRNQNVTGILNRDTVNRQYQLTQKLFSWLQFIGSSSVSFSQVSGKTAVKQGSFAINHANIHILPGNTSVQIRNSLNRTGDLASPTSNVTNTFSVSTPLKYLKGKLSVNTRYDVNEQRGIAPTQETVSNTRTKTIDANFAFTPSFSFGGGGNSSDTCSETLPNVTAIGANKTITQRASLNIKHPLTKSFKIVPAFNYTISNSRNRNSSYFPAASKTETDTLKNSGTFIFSGTKWNGSYVLEKSMNKPDASATSRATQQKFAFTFSKLLKFDWNLNYSITKQPAGSVGSGVFAAKRAFSPNSNLGLSYQFSKNQVFGTTNRISNTMDRIFELTFEQTL